MLLLSVDVTNLAGVFCILFVTSQNKFVKRYNIFAYILVVLVFILTISTPFLYEDILELFVRVKVHSTGIENS